MNEVEPHSPVIRFGVFEVNLESAVLRRNGMKVRLQEKPFQMLVALLENPGEMVSREELRGRLWGDVNVEYEHGLNIVANRLRRALEDSADNPKFVETVPRRGYRFIAPVQGSALSAPTGAEDFKGPGNTPVPQNAFSRTRGTLWLIGTVAVLILIAGTFWKWNADDEAEFAFQEGGWVLVCPFTNETGDPSFDGTVERVLETELEISSFVNIVPQERVQDTLKLMRLSPDTRINLDTARQVSLRDGEIDGVLVGRIERNGTDYEIHFLLIDPASEGVLAAMTRSVSNQNQIRPVIQEQVEWVVDRLGSAVRNTESEMAPKLQKVTTTSLTALQLYSRAARESLTVGGQDEALAREAVAEDPEFASAHLLLAWALRNRGQHKGAQDAMDKAMELRELVSPAERSFILASSYHWRLEYTEAVAHYTNLFDLQPEHPWGWRNLFNIHRAFGKLDLAAGVLLERAERLPNSLQAQEISASLLIHPLAQLERARPVIDRARNLLRDNPGLIAGHYTGSWTLSVGIWQKWLEEDVEGAVEEANRVQILLKANQQKNYLLGRDATFLGYQFLSLGKVDAARALLLDYQARSINFPVILAFIDQDPELLNEQPTGSGGAIAAFVRLDLEASPMKQAEEHAKNEFDGGRRELILGKVALQAGQVDEAISLLEKSLRLLPGSSLYHVTELFFASLALSEAWEAKNRLVEATRVLETASTYRKRSYPESGALWVVVQVRLAKLYRDLGETEQAEDIEDRVRLLLRHANSELPPMMRLED